MSREQHLLLQDIAEACLKISDWTRALPYGDFTRHEMVYSAVLRELLVIGEAIKQLSAEMRDGAPEVPWRAWAGLRDIVVHQYFGLQDATLWQIVTEEIPAVASAVAALITSLPDAD